MENGRLGFGVGILLHFHCSNLQRYIPGANCGKYQGSACSGISHFSGDLLLVSLSKPSRFI
jgi:hypothetical protein